MLKDANLGIKKVNIKHVALLVAIIASSLFIHLLIPAGITPAQEQHYGLWSLLPAGLTLLVCFVSRNVFLAMFLGVLSGSLVSGQLNIFKIFLMPSIAEGVSELQTLALYLLLLALLLGLWKQIDIAKHLVVGVAKRFVNSAKSAKLFAWLMGVLFHQGGTISTVIAGSTARPICDKHGVAREELAYIVDSTASPIATIIPFNAWPIYVASLITIEPLSAIISTQQSAVTMFLKAIPFNFYAWIAVTMTLLFSLEKLPLFNTSMAKAVQRSRASREKVFENSNANLRLNLDLSNSDYNTRLSDFYIPILVFIVANLSSWLLSSSFILLESFSAAVLTAYTICLARGLNIKMAFYAMCKGLTYLAIAALIIGLALTLAQISSYLGTAAFVIENTSSLLQTWPIILPSLLLVTCMVVAFSIGSSWGTYAVMFPIALPLALSLSQDPNYLLLCFGAVMGGAAFGDQCSPMSDTTILSAMACGCDLMDHVNTQLPFALVAATFSIALYLIASVLVL